MLLYTRPIARSETKPLPKIATRVTNRESPRVSRFHGGPANCTMLFSQATSMCLARRGPNEYASSCSGKIVLSTTFWTGSPACDVSGFGSTGVSRHSNSASRHRDELADARAGTARCRDLGTRWSGLRRGAPDCPRTLPPTHSTLEATRSARTQPTEPVRQSARRSCWNCFGRGCVRPRSFGGSEALTARTPPGAEQRVRLPAVVPALAATPSGHHLRNIEDEKGARQMRAWRHSGPNFGRAANAMCVRAQPGQAHAAHAQIRWRSRLT